MGPRTQAAREDIDRLYGLPLGSFTRARDELATRLKQSGDVESATEIKRLRKPSLPAWAVNQLVRRSPEEMSRLVEIRSQMKAAKSADEVRHLTQSRHRLIAELVAQVEKVLTEAGHSMNAQTRQRIVQTLHAAGVEGDAHAILTGRLTRELSATGFEGFAIDTGEEAPTDTVLSQRAEQEARRLADEADEAETEARLLSERAERAREQAETAADAATRAQERARTARQRARRAAEEAEGARA